VQKPRSRARLWVVLASALVILAAAAPFALAQIELLRANAAGSQPGRLTIVTHPDGASVMVDGQSRGMTPLTLSVSPGPHTVSIRSGINERVLMLTVRGPGLTESVSGVIPRDRSEEHTSELQSL